MEEQENTLTRCLQAPAEIAHHHDRKNDRDEEKNDCDCSYRYRQLVRGRSAVKNSQKVESDFQYCAYCVFLF